MSIFLGFTSHVLAEILTVTIEDEYNPKTITINVGDTITWINQDPGVFHSTTQDAKLWSGDMNPGGTFSFMFNNPGKYTYHCRFHPSMTATVNVLDQGTIDPKICLFSWAESTYAQLFSPAGNLSFLTFPPFTYRYYPQTDSYLAVSSVDNHLYYMFGVDGIIYDAGAFSDWLITSNCK
jgi:hypothetical protein